jgi:teichuronic acid biosynthesis glycosyltransferase TuaG
MLNNLVSIITPSFNSSQFIIRAIESVLSQTYKEWELIIVDDGSEDNSVESIENFIKNKEQIYLIKLNKNIGAANARNEALKVAKGRYIAFLDSDDIWYPNKLELQIKFMRLNNYPVSFTSYEIIDQHSQLMHKEVHCEKKVSLRSYVKNTIIGFSSSMIDRKLVQHDFKFSNLKVAEDLLFWIEIFENGYKAYGLDLILLKYRVHSKSLSANKYKSAKQILKIYLYKFGYIRAIYYFCFYTFNAIKKRVV